MKKFTFRWLLLLLAVPVLGTMACSSDGSAGASVDLDGTWSGSWDQSGIPSALSDFNFAHSTTGTFSVDLTDNGDDTVSGTITTDPGICAEGSTELSETVTADVSGTLTTDTLTFTYASSQFAVSGNVIFTASFPADPMTGEYDGSACDSVWVGGFRLEKQ